jgi:hypothetical protein
MATDNISTGIIIIRGLASRGFCGYLRLSNLKRIQFAFDKDIYFTETWDIFIGWSRDRFAPKHNIGVKMLSLLGVVSIDFGQETYSC